MITLKSGVKLNGMSPQIMLAILFAQYTWFQWFRHYPFVITSVTDGHHSKGSKHYIGNAFDLRVRGPDNDWSAPEQQRRSYCDALKRRLGKEFDIVLHEGGSAHIHIEWDPEE